MHDDEEEWTLLINPEVARYTLSLLCTSSGSSLSRSLHEKCPTCRPDAL
jgi:rRNA maturation protein Nop10